MDYISRMSDLCEERQAVQQQKQGSGWTLVCRVQEGNLDLRFQGRFRLSLLLVTFLGVIVFLLTRLL